MLIPSCVAPCKEAVFLPNKWSWQPCWGLTNHKCTDHFWTLSKAIVLYLSPIPVSYCLISTIKLLWAVLVIWDLLKSHMWILYQCLLLQESPLNSSMHHTEPLKTIRGTDNSWTRHHSLYLGSFINQTLGFSVLNFYVSLVNFISF